MHNNTYLPYPLSEMSMQNVDYCIHPFTRLQKFILSQVENEERSIDFLSIYEEVSMSISKYLTIFTRKIFTPLFRRLVMKI